MKSEKWIREKLETVGKRQKEILFNESIYGIPSPYEENILLTVLEIILKEVLDEKD